MKRLLKSILVSLWCVSACPGQEVWYLSPRAFHVEPGAEMPISVVRAGAEGGAEAGAEIDPAAGEELPTEEIAFPSEVAAHVFVRGGGRQWNLHHPEPIEVDGVASAWTRVPMPDVGVAMIGTECDPVVEVVTADQLKAFVSERAPTFSDLDMPQRDDIRVRVVRCAKTLVRIDDGKTEDMASPIPASKAGQRNEIRLSGDPTVLDVSAGASEIPLRLYADWHSRKDVTFKATNTTTGDDSIVHVNAYGNGPMVVDAAGIWHVEFHYLLDVRDDEMAGVDFELHSATLTFMVDEGAAR